MLELRPIEDRVEAGVRLARDLDANIGLAPEDREMTMRAYWEHEEILKRDPAWWASRKGEFARHMHALSQRAFIPTAIVTRDYTPSPDPVKGFLLWLEKIWRQINP